MCLVTSTGMELWVRDVHVVVAELTAGSSAALMSSRRMAFWSGSVAAAEAKKAEDASMHALLKPRRPKPSVPVSWLVTIACLIASR